MLPLLFFPCWFTCFCVRTFCTNGDNNNNNIQSENSEVSDGKSCIKTTVLSDSGFDSIRYDSFAESIP